MRRHKNGRHRELTRHKLKGEDEEGGLHPVTLDLISVTQGRADVLGDAGFTDLCRTVGQITGNGEALVTSDKSTHRKLKARVGARPVDKRVRVQPCVHVPARPAGLQLVESRHVKLEDVGVLVHVTDLSLLGRLLNSVVGLEVVEEGPQHFEHSRVEQHHGCRTDTARSGPRTD